MKIQTCHLTISNISSVVTEDSFLWNISQVLFPQVFMHSWSYNLKCMKFDYAFFLQKMGRLLCQATD